MNYFSNWDANSLIHEHKQTSTIPGNITGSRPTVKCGLTDLQTSDEADITGMYLILITSAVDL